MNGLIKKIKDIFPVTTTKAVYIDGTSKTLQEAIDKGELGGSVLFEDVGEFEKMKYINYDESKTFEIVNGYAFINPLQLKACEFVDFGGIPYESNEGGMDFYRISYAKGALFFETQIADSPCFYLSSDIKELITLDTTGVSADYKGKTSGRYYVRRINNYPQFSLIIPHDESIAYPDVFEWAYALSPRWGIKLKTDLLEYDIKSCIDGKTISFATSDEEYYMGCFNTVGDDINRKSYLMSTAFGICKNYTFQECVYFTSNGTRLNYKIKKSNVSENTANTIRDYLLNTLGLKIYYVE